MMHQALEDLPAEGHCIPEDLDAIHESGHAIAALSLQMKLHYVSLETDPPETQATPSGWNASTEDVFTLGGAAATWVLRDTLQGGWEELALAPSEQSWLAACTLMQRFRSQVEALAEALKHRPTLTASDVYELFHDKPAPPHIIAHSWLPSDRR